MTPENSIENSSGFIEAIKQEEDSLDLAEEDDSKV